MIAGYVCGPRSLKIPSAWSSLVWTASTFVCSRMVRWEYGTGCIRRVSSLWLFFIRRTRKVA